MTAKTHATHATHATHMAGRQVCRKTLHTCIPAVTLTFDGGSRRLHWCADHAADADRYREQADSANADNREAI